MIHFILLGLLLALQLGAQTAQFPTSVADDQDLAVAKDRSASTLNGGIDDTTTTVVVASGTQFVQYQIITIDNEQMMICSISTNTLTACGRGFGGTSAASHANGAAVRGQITAWHHNALSAEIKALESSLGAALANVPLALYCADAGSTDAYACTLSPAITAYNTGTHYFFRANTVNTGAATINFNSLGAKTIRKFTSASPGADLADNDIRAGQIVELVYDGNNMQMVSALGNEAVTAASTLTADLPMFGDGSRASKVGTKTGTGNELVASQSPVIVTPTVASFTNAQHNHQNAAGGGVLAAAAMPTTAALLHIAILPIIATTWTDMPAAVTEMFGFANNRTRVDLTGATSVKLEGNVIVAGSTSAVLRAQYSTDNSAWNALPASGETEIAINTTGHKEDGFENIATGAKANVYIRLVGVNGDGAADPTLGLVFLQVK